MADNYRVDVIGDEKAMFDLAIRLAFMAASWSDKLTTAKCWAVKGRSLILIAYPETDGQRFPMALTTETAIAFCWEWLQQQDYPPEPDQDGSNKRGFWITTSDAPDYGRPDIWHRPGGFHGGIVRITPEWCMYGK